ncbi:glycogen synthase [Streptomyces sp. YGL11-2]|uniref:glycogen synthase n=1 Tax=Streptomyces sp. YGL11-2 TaxID=3414028 RepID=UPI003CE8C7A3
MRTGGITATPSVHRLLDHGGPYEVFLLRADGWYDRGGIYRDSAYVEFTDAVDRAAFFGHCVAQWVVGTGRRYDLVHANDWQSGAAVAHLRAARGDAELPRLLMNVHSAAYRGELRSPEASGLPPQWLETLLARADGEPNLLLLGLLAADAATTGSPGYAGELTAELAHTPMGDALAAQEFTGIVAGVDPTVWDPAKNLPTTFDAASVTAGKRANKIALQERAGLKSDLDVPVVGVCARLVEEKGIDLMLSGLGPLLRDGSAQLVIVGPAEGRYRAALADLISEAPLAVHHTPAFEQGLAWLVYAGADFTVMPSRVEPCGLNQLIAMAYGTMPLVTAVGGLRDTVTDLVAWPESGTGFVIAGHSAAAVRTTAVTAVTWWREQPDAVHAARVRAMTQDWSWARTARHTATLYHALTRNHARDN